jgi:hypothetical protein
MPPVVTSSPANDAAIISAFAGISGVILGGLITTMKDVLLNRSKNKADKTYLSILVGAHLDRYINGCYRMALDDGQSHDPWDRYLQQERRPQVTAPGFNPLDFDVEWKLLPPQLMHDILGIPHEAESVEASIAYVAMTDEDDHEHLDFFWARREQWGYLGLKVVDIATRLRRLSGLAKAPRSDIEWSVASGLQDAVNKVGHERKKYAERVAAIEAKRASETDEA